MFRNCKFRDLAGPRIKLAEVMPEPGVAKDFLFQPAALGEPCGVRRHAVRVNGMTCLSLGHLDVLSGIGEISICVGYKTASGLITELPRDLVYRDDIEPMYETMPGWTEDLSEVRRFHDLPLNTQNFVVRVGELAGVRIATVSVGPGREQTIIDEEVLV